MKYSIFCVLFFLAACAPKNDVRIETAVAEQRDLSVSVTATGTIEPVTKVEVGTQVSGIIDKIYVDYNSIVHRGQVIAELDRTNLLSELTSAQSNLANAQSQLTYEAANHERYRKLYDKGLIAAADYEKARLSYEQAVQQVTINMQNVAKAQTNLGYATITAPIDGVVLSKEVEEGQTVASAMTTPTLFIIAKDLTDMRVIADIDEADIGEVREGQNVTFTVDAFPNDVFRGKVTQVRQEAKTTSNVVTYEVVISAPNEDLKLKPGLTANVTVFTFEKPNALCIPSKALKYMPNPMLLPEGTQIQDCDSPHKVWKMDGQTIKAIPVTTGATGGSLTEIESGLSAGDEIVTGASMLMEEAQDSQTKNPFMPTPPNRNKKK